MGEPRGFLAPSLGAAKIFAAVVLGFGGGFHRLQDAANPRGAQTVRPLESGVPLGLEGRRGRPHDESRTQTARATRGWRSWSRAGKLGTGPRRERARSRSWGPGSGGSFPTW